MKAAIPWSSFKSLLPLNIVFANVDFYVGDMFRIKRIDNMNQIGNKVVLDLRLIEMYKPRKNAFSAFFYNVYVISIQLAKWRKLEWK